MSTRAATRLAWSLFAFSLALVVAGSVLGLSAGIAFSGRTGLWVAYTLVAGPVGGLVASRHPRNPIGWILCGLTVWAGISLLAAGYAEHALADGVAAGAFGEQAAWLANWSYVPFVLVPATFLLLLFPDGWLPSRRFRYIAWCAGLLMAFWIVTTAVNPGKLADFPSAMNPYAVDAPALQKASDAVVPLVLVCVLASAASAIARARRATAVERQQIKWLAYAGAFEVACLVGGTIAAGLGSDTFGLTLVFLGVLSLPVAIGIAILRYRLYDIDRIVNRTLVYGVLSAGLAGLYFGIVIALQQVFSSFAGGSDLAVAGSTLAVAALFRPARRRIQALVDRRFYRRRYDAQRTLEAFSGRLRDEIDLEALAAELRRVVQETVQPAHLSLWLRRPD